MCTNLKMIFGNRHMTFTDVALTFYVHEKKRSRAWTISHGKKVKEKRDQMCQTGWTEQNKGNNTSLSASFCTFSFLLLFTLHITTPPPVFLLFLLLPASLCSLIMNRAANPHLQFSLQHRHVWRESQNAACTSITSISQLPLFFSEYNIVPKMKTLYTVFIFSQQKIKTP